MSKIDNAGNDTKEDTEADMLLNNDLDDQNEDVDMKIDQLQQSLDKQNFDLTFIKQKSSDGSYDMKGVISACGASNSLREDIKSSKLSNEYTL